MTDTHSEVTRAHLGMLLWVLLVGLSFPVVGLLSQGLPPLSLTALRFAIAAFAVWPLVGGAPDFWPSQRGFALYALKGLCQAAFFGAMFWAAHRATALSMAVLYVSVPLLAYGLGRGFGVERPEWRLPAILALGAGGALALAWAEGGGRLDALQLGVGEGVYFAGCAGIALHPVLTKWGLERGWLSERASLRTFWSLVIGALLVASLGLIGESPRALAAMTALDFAIVAYLGVFSSGVTFWLMQRATAALTPGAATAYTYLTPFVSMLLLFAAEPQRLSWHWLPGGVLVVLAVALLMRRSGVKSLRRLTLRFRRPQDRDGRPPDQGIDQSVNNRTKSVPGAAAAIAAYRNL